MLDPQEQFAQWLEGIDPNQPVSELIDPAWLEGGITFTSEELEYLLNEGREYAQELLEQGMITATLPPLDIPDRFLEQTHGKEGPDLGR